MEWVDGNIGSKATMKYPACILAEPYAKASTMSLGFAGQGQYQDTGAKMIHLAPHPGYRRQWPSWILPRRRTPRVSRLGEDRQGSRGLFELHRL